MGVDRVTMGMYHSQGSYPLQDYGGPLVGYFTDIGGGCKEDDGCVPYDWELPLTRLWRTLT